jgi:hypothetical protein
VNSDTFIVKKPQANQPFFKTGKLLFYALATRQDGTKGRMFFQGYNQPQLPRKEKRTMAKKRGLATQVLI